jgi:type III restriction enzyme
MQKLEFYEFASLKKYLPNIQSINEFITSDNYLGNVRLEVQGLANQVLKLSADDKLHATIQVLESIADQF